VREAPGEASQFVEAQGFCRHCLQFLESRFGPMREVERAHAEHVSLSNAATETGRQVYSQAGDEHIAVVGSRLPMLFLVDDTRYSPTPNAATISATSGSSEITNSPTSARLIRVGYFAGCVVQRS